MSEDCVNVIIRLQMANNISIQVHQSNVRIMHFYMDIIGIPESIFYDKFDINQLTINAYITAFDTFVKAHNH